MGQADSGEGFDRRGVVMALALAAAHLGLIFLRRHLVAVDTSVAVWPASGLLVAAMLRYPRWRWPLLGACVSVTVVTSFSVLNGVRSIIGAVELAIMAEMGLRLCGPNPNPSDPRVLFKLLAGAVAPACLVSGGLVFATAPVIPNSEPALWSASWILGHALGAAIFLPALLILMDRRRHAALKRSDVELAFSTLAFLAAVLALFTFGKAWAFIVFPAAMVLAFRHGPVGAAAAVLVLGAVALAYLYGWGVLPFLSSEIRADTGWVQFFVLVVLLTTVPAAGAVSSYARMKTLLARRTEIARRARRRADAAARAKSEFLANLSHEIRTPLNGVIGLADALSHTELASAQREMLGMILTSGRGLTALLSDALDLARTESGSMRLAAEPFDVRRIIGEAAFLFESLAREKGLAFEAAFDLDPPAAAVGDPLRVKQIVSNLISNAVKFTAHGSVTVEVAFRRSGEMGLLQVLVRDTGPGFDAAVKARLFNRFEQGDGSVTRRFGGSGLGLAIAHRLAALMGGELTGEGRPGQGAEFVLRLPLPMASAPVAAAEPEAPGFGEGERPRRVLLAEDNPINQKVVQAILGGLVELTAVGDGRAAVEAARREAFDIILMDTHMPEMDGLSAIRAIREMERRRGALRTPIVSLTADALPQHVQAAMAAGADLHLAKPITAESLIRSLEAVRRAGHADEQARAG